MSDSQHRAGFVAILGAPNAGKSTLLNHLLGEKLAIVTAKPQTTRSRILGILTRPDAQLMLVDTPGLHDSTKPLNAALNNVVEEALGSCDLALLLVDRRAGWGRTQERLLSDLSRAGKPVLVVGTRADLARKAGVEWPPRAAVVAEAVMDVSGITGQGVEALLEQVIQRLPESPPLYPSDEVTDRPLRFLVAEQVRESATECLGQELPYMLAVEVTAFDESRPDLSVIRANILIARNSQKRIVVGKGGEMIREIGSRARPGIESLVGNQVHLDLFVKVDPKWLKNPKRIEALGYR
ncbi:MAG: GTPase Era [Myxococcota bacterium]|nr:GTPase Era [Myxococcota bacterium]